MTLGRVAAALVLVGLWLLACPADLFAWTPGTHIYLGEMALANLHLLPPAIASLLHAFPYDYLYGIIAPDTSIAKKYVPPGRHSHFWTVGRETFDVAESDALRAFGLGYLSHLAADTVAHNYFVPRQLLLTSSTKTMGHTYWESRIETHLGDRYARMAREIILRDQTGANQHLERIISPTIFSVRTNRRIFRGMVHLAHTKGWQRAMQAVRERSRWLLTEGDLELHFGTAYNLTMEMLAAAEGQMDKVIALALDPNGAQALRAAKRLRRQVLSVGQLGSPSRLLDLAEENFGILPLELGYWTESKVPRPWRESSDAAPAEKDTRRLILPAGD
ncbi:MAG: zinc dependent phospholipase C family protein [Gemmatimonadales bacterium]|nr:zinc dependent phospholipase C family protein [Gemmatimonadales bacterium]